MEQYIKLQSIISDFIAINIYYIFHNNITGDIVPLKDNDIELIKPFINTDTVCNFPQKGILHNLLYLYLSILLLGVLM